MRIGITGATGFIGRHCAQAAEARGHEVVAYTRGGRGLPPPGRQVLRQSAQSPHALPETRLDALVHLAGESLMGLWTAAKRDRIWKSRVDFTEKLVAHLRTWKPENRPQIFICASGIGYYGDSGAAPVEESAPRGSGFLAEVCQGWETAALQAEDLGMRVVHLRTSMVLGRNGGAFPLLRRLFRLGLGGRLGSGDQWMSWIHVEDEAGLILKALETSTLRGPINLCSPEPVTNADFTRALAAALHRPAFCHAPAFALRLLLRGMADEMLLSGQRGVPRAAMENGYEFAHPTLAGALRVLV